MPLQLYDLDDASTFCWHLIGRGRLTLSYHERQDLHAFLLGECWRLSLKFEPRHGLRFSTFATRGLRLRTVDWIRKEKGRTRWQFSGGRVHERERPRLVPLDDHLVDTLPARTGDPADDCDPSLRGLDADRDRQRARDLDHWVSRRMLELRAELERLGEVAPG